MIVRDAMPAWLRWRRHPDEIAASVGFLAAIIGFGWGSSDFIRGDYPSAALTLIVSCILWWFESVLNERIIRRLRGDARMGGENTP
jgi:hypothetical protein